MNAGYKAWVKAGFELAELGDLPFQILGSNGVSIVPTDGTPASQHLKKHDAQ